MVALLEAEQQQLTQNRVPSEFQLREPVIVIYGADALHVDKVESSARLFRLFRKLGRCGIPIRLLVRGGRALEAESVDALNLFLQHGRGLRLFSGIHSAPSRWNAEILLGDFLSLKWGTLRRA